MTALFNFYKFLNVFVIKTVTHPVFYPPKLPSFAVVAYKG